MYGMRCQSNFLAPLRGQNICKKKSQIGGHAPKFLMNEIISLKYASYVYVWVDVKMGIGKLRSRRRRPRWWLGVSGKRQLDPDKMQKQGSRERGKVIKQIRKKRK